MKKFVLIVWSSPEKESIVGCIGPFHTAEGATNWVTLFGEDKYFYEGLSVKDPQGIASHAVSL